MQSYFSITSSDLPYISELPIKHPLSKYMCWELFEEQDIVEHNIPVPYVGVIIFIIDKADNEEIW